MFCPSFSPSFGQPLMKILNLDGTVGKATRLHSRQLRNQGVIPERAYKSFFFSKMTRPPLGQTQPPLWQVVRALFSGVKWPGNEVNHSSAFTIEVNNEWVCTSTPPYAIMACAERTSPSVYRF